MVTVKDGGPGLVEFLIHCSPDTADRDIVSYISTVE